MHTGPLGLTMGLTEWGEGPKGHMGPWSPWGHQGSPTVYPWCMEGWGGGSSGMVPRGLWAAQDVEQGALTPTESFLLHQH